MPDWHNSVLTGDCFDRLDDLPNSSVHACVTDPPYGLAFMGRDWDDFEPKEYQEWCEDWASEVKRVLKPGGHLLAFSGNRTHHRLFTGVEDAGFEVRDTLTWHYGSGFPKAADVSKQIDKRADAEREVVGEGQYADRKPNGSAGVNSVGLSESPGYKETAPATDAAERWDGWKTGLKPATEFVVMARKPFDGATVDCVLEHGTGALNVDGCRVETEDDLERKQGGDITGDNYNDADGDSDIVTPDAEGRYPSDVIFDEVEAERLDEQVGELSGGYYPEERTDNEIYDNGEGTNIETGDSGESRDDSGGPSRYFYTSKATKAERTLDGKIDNAHPTVKPIDLMEWLIKLVTREGQVVIDPFAGSGTTCKAAKGLNREFVGIERQEQWADVARVRAGLAPHDPSNVRDNDDQTGLEAFADGGDDDA